jgi:hypothetical protein
MARYRRVLAALRVVAAHAACLPVALAALVLLLDRLSPTVPVTAFTIALVFGHVVAGFSTRSLVDSYRTAFFAALTGCVAGVLGGLAELAAVTSWASRSVTLCWDLANPTPPPTNLMDISVAIGIPLGYALIGAAVSLVGRAVAEYRAR